METRLPNDLLEFEGDFSLEGLRLWKTAFSAMAESPRPGSPSHYGHSTVNKGESNSHKTSEDKKIVIMPCKCAPSQQQVQIWLHAKEEYEHFKKLPKNHPAEQAKADESFSSAVLSEEKSIEVIKVARDLNLSSLEDERPVVPTKTSPASVAENTKTQTKESCDKSISTIGTSVNTKNVIDSNKTSCASKTHSTSALEHDKEEEEDEEDYYVSYSSPDSPVLPPWQQVASPDPKQSNLEDTEWKNQDIILSSGEGNDVRSTQNSPCTQENIRTSFDTSPLPVNEDPGNSESVCLHSTPIAHRKKQDGIPEVLGFTPLSAGKSIK